MRCDICVVQRPSITVNEELFWWDAFNDDKVRVKGKSSPLICYELLTFTEKKTKEIIELKEAFEDGFSLYQKEKFEQAKAKFSHALELERNSSNDVNPSKLYISRCDKFIINPPKDWDGVWSLTEK